MGEGWGPQPFTAENCLGALCFPLCVLFWRWWDPGEEMVWLEVAKGARELQAGQKQLHGVEAIKHY